MIGELVCGELLRVQEVVVHLFPKRRGRMIEEQAPIEQRIRIRRYRALRYWRPRSQRRGVLQRRPRAILTFPVLRRPGVVIKIANASVVRRYPIMSRQLDIEDLVYIAVNRDISIEEHTSFVVGKLERAKLGPGVFEAGGNESGFLAGREK